MQAITRFLKATSLGAALAIAMGTAARAAEAESQATITINAPLEKVWKLLVEVDKWPLWNPAVQSVRVDGVLNSGTAFVWKSQGFEVTSTFQDIQPMTRLTWSGKAFGTRAFHTWELQQTGNAVTVKTNETFDGWLPWLMTGSMQKTLDETLPKWLATLKVAAERGN